MAALRKPLQRNSRPRPKLEIAFELEQIATRSVDRQDKKLVDRRMEVRSNLDTTPLLQTAHCVPLVALPTQLLKLA